MVRLQEYLDEQSSNDSFIVHPASPETQRGSMQSFLSPSDANDARQSTELFIPQWTSELEPIQEQSRRRSSLTNPDVSSPLPLSMDVFGESVGSLDVWAEEDVFQSSRKTRNSKRRSSHRRRRVPQNLYEERKLRNDE